MTKAEKLRLAKGLIHYRCAQVSEEGFGTDIGMCSFIVSESKEDKIRWNEVFFDITPGVTTGEPNGLRLLLDAEVFDSGPGQATSQGFKVQMFLAGNQLYDWYTHR